MRCRRRAAAAVSGGAVVSFSKKGNCHHCSSSLLVRRATENDVYLSSLPSPSRRITYVREIQTGVEVRKGNQPLEMRFTVENLFDFLINAKRFIHDVAAYIKKTETSVCNYCRGSRGCGAGSECIIAVFIQFVYIIRQ